MKSLFLTLVLSLSVLAHAEGLEDRVAAHLAEAFQLQVLNGHDGESYQSSYLSGIQVKVNTTEVTGRYGFEVTSGSGRREICSGTFYSLTSRIEENTDCKREIEDWIAHKDD